jgi:hypothetical protein
MKDIDFSKEMDIKINEIHQEYTGTYTGFIIQMMNSLSITQIHFYDVECELNGKNVRLHYLTIIKCQDFTYKLELGYFDSIDDHKTIEFGELSLSDMERVVKIVVDYINRMKEKTCYTIKFSSEFDIGILKRDALTINDAKEWIDKHWSRLIDQNKRKIINKIIYQLTPKEEDI